MTNGAGAHKTPAGQVAKAKNKRARNKAADKAKSVLTSGITKRKEKR